MKNGDAVWAASPFLVFYFGFLRALLFLTFAAFAFSRPSSFWVAASFCFCLAYSTPMPVILWRTVMIGWRRSILFREPSMISMKVLFAASPKHFSSQ